MFGNIVPRVSLRHERERRGPKACVASTRKARKAKVNAENAGTPRGYACEFLADDTLRGLCIFARLCFSPHSSRGPARFVVTHALYLNARRRVLALECARARASQKYVILLFTSARDILVLWPWCVVHRKSPSKRQRRGEAFEKIIDERWILCI